MNSGGNDGSEVAPDLEESSVTEWTDEKHSLYLKSIESSFVNQLYDSLDYPGHNFTSKKQKICPSTQIKVLQDGLWQDVHFKKPDYRLSKGDEFDSVVPSLWIRRFRSVSKLHRCRTRSLHEKEAIQEVSDQNFVDESLEGLNNAEDKDCSKGSKRMISSSVNEKTSSSFDQVVP